MGIDDRVRRLERGKTSEPCYLPATGLAYEIREGDLLIGRLKTHIAKQEANEEGYDESYDEAIFGESLEEHIRRVTGLDAMYDAQRACLSEGHTISELDAGIAAVLAEIDQLEAEDGGGDLT